MKPIFESNLDNSTPLQRVDEIFGIETFGKIRDKIGGAVQDSLRANKFRQQNSKLEKYRTDMANRAAMRRQWELSNKDPNMFVRGNFSRKLGDMEQEFADRRTDNMMANAQGIDQYAAARDQEGQAAEMAYDGYTNGQVSEFNGATPPKPPTPPPTNPTQPRRNNAPRITNRELYALLNNLTQAIQNNNQSQIVNITNQIAATAKEGGGQPPANPPTPDSATAKPEEAKPEQPTAETPVASAEQVEDAPAAQPAAQPAEQATQPEPAAQPAAQPTQPAAENPAPAKQPTAKKPRARGKKATTENAPKAGQQVVANSYVPEIKTGFSSLFESQIFGNLK